MSTSKVLAIDPGDVQSAYVLWDGQQPIDKGLVPNEDLLVLLEQLAKTGAVLTIEMIASYGMAVGREIFETCVWIGRFTQHWKSLTGKECDLVFRRDIKLHHTESPRAKDSNVIQALKDRFGYPGTKNNPNPVTYGMKKDIWQAFALAVYWHDKYADSLK